MYYIMHTISCSTRMHFYKLDVTKYLIKINIYRIKNCIKRFIILNIDAKFTMKRGLIILYDWEICLQQHKHNTAWTTTKYL